MFLVIEGAPPQLPWATMGGKKEGAPNWAGKTLVIKRMCILIMQLRKTYELGQ